MKHVALHFQNAFMRMYTICSAPKSRADRKVEGVHTYQQATRKQNIIQTQLHHHQHRLPARRTAT